MIKFLLGMVVGIGLLLLAGYLYLASGGMNMGTSGGPLPLERFLAGKAIDASIGKSAGDESPLPADEINLLAGAKVYQQNCAFCHGRLDQATASPMAKMVYPHVPQLLPPGHGVMDDPVGTTHWVVKNGIRLSAMPAFGATLSDPETWQVSQLLRNADHLPASVQEILRQKE